MEYVNLTKNINNIKKAETKREEQKILENMKDEIYKRRKIQQRDPNHLCHH